MKKLSQLLESINEVNSLLELDFKSKDSFQKYQAKHKMKPTTKVNIAGKDTTVGDEMGDDSETPQAPKKTTGADIEKQADKSGKEVDDIEKDITGDLMGDEPKKEVDSEDLDAKDFQAAKQAFDKIKDIDMDAFEDGPEGYEQMMDALELLKGTQLDNYKTLQRDIDALKTNQEQDSAELVRYTLSSLKDKKDPFSGKYLGDVKNENFDLRQLSKITTRYNK